MERYAFAFSDDIIEDFLFFHLHPDYERANWGISSLPWDKIQPEKAEKHIVEWVKASAIFECTAYGGALNFYREFSDDLDFTQWVSLWSADEIKHPFVLAKWLRAVGVPFDQTYMEANRDAYPIGKSRVRTLAVNIISEMKAAAWYRMIAERTQEPVLKRIMFKLSGDEARHAGSFFLYARKYIENATNPAREKRDLLTILYTWIATSQQRLPFAEFFQDGATENVKRVQELAEDFDPRDVENRICGLFGSLAGVPINGPADIKQAIRKITA